MNWLRRILPPRVKALLRPFYRFICSASRKTLHIFLKALRAILGERFFLRACHLVSEEIETTVVIADHVFEANSFIPYYRARTLLTKEPDTIAWIDDCVGEGDVFYDIGANIGVFSLYAAKKRGASVIAFEPFAGNYETLNKNIYLNGLSSTITALNLAAHDEVALSKLHVSQFKAGKAGNSFSLAIGSNHEEYEAEFEQGMIGMPIDRFIEMFDAPFPNHIKIDVDGNEPNVVDGMRGVLKNKALKSIAIELNPIDRDIDNSIMKIIEENGFKPLDGDQYINKGYLSLGNLRNYFFIR